MTCVRKKWYGRLFTDDIVLDAKDVDRLPRYIQVLDENKNHLTTIEAHFNDFEDEDGNQLGGGDNNRELDLKNYIAGK
jgi:hypothetical protein